MTNPDATSSHRKVAAVLLVLGAAASLLPIVTAPEALVGGLAIGLLFGNPWIARTRKATHPLLQASVIGLGFGMDLGIVLRVGAHGLLYTVTGIAGCFAAGMALARVLAVPGDVGLLTTVGTAICGGSAIAAVVPAIRAKDHEASIALATVFLLNAVGLILFPLIGHALGLDETRFGLWAALAIHDTSSVVGAATAYGKTSVQIATTVKLARALWIAPVALAIGALRARRDGAGAGAPRLKVPWFIFGFIGAAALVTLVPATASAGMTVSRVAKQLLVLTLFLIGAGLDRAALREVGVRPMLHGLILWILVAGTTLAAILGGLIH